jgi:hypothetical protein
MSSNMAGAGWLQEEVSLITPAARLFPVTGLLSAGYVVYRHVGKWMITR